MQSVKPSSKPNSKPPLKIKRNTPFSSTPTAQSDEPRPIKAKKIGYLPGPGQVIKIMITTDELELEIEALRGDFQKMALQNDQRPAVSKDKFKDFVDREAQKPNKEVFSFGPDQRTKRIPTPRERISSFLENDPEEAAKSRRKDICQQEENVLHQYLPAESLKEYYTTNTKTNQKNIDSEKLQAMKRLEVNEFSAIGKSNSNTKLPEEKYSIQSKHLEAEFLKGYYGIEMLKTPMPPQIKGLKSHTLSSPCFAPDKLPSIREQEEDEESRSTVFSSHLPLEGAKNLCSKLESEKEKKLLEIIGARVTHDFATENEEENLLEDLEKPNDSSPVYDLKGQPPRRFFDAPSRFEPDIEVLNSKPQPEIQSRKSMTGQIKAQESAPKALFKENKTQQPLPLQQKNSLLPSEKASSKNEHKMRISSGLGKNTRTETPNNMISITVSASLSNSQKIKGSSPLIEKCSVRMTGPSRKAENVAKSNFKLIKEVRK